MNLGVFSSNGNAGIIAMNVKIYNDVLQKSLFPIIELHVTDKVLFQPDNAAMLSSKQTKILSKCQSMKFLDQPVEFPDPNPKDQFKIVGSVIKTLWWNTVTSSRRNFT